MRLRDFGCSVLCPSGPVEHDQEELTLSRASCEKAAQAAIRGDQSKFESVAGEWGNRIGAQIYEAYLAGRVEKSGLRHSFLRISRSRALRAKFASP